MPLETPEDYRKWMNSDEYKDAFPHDIDSLRSYLASACLAYSLLHQLDGACEGIHTMNEDFLICYPMRELRQQWYELIKQAIDSCIAHLTIVDPFWMARDLSDHDIQTHVVELQQSTTAAAASATVKEVA